MVSVVDNIIDMVFRWVVIVLGIFFSFVLILVFFFGVNVAVIFLVFYESLCMFLTVLFLDFDIIVV